MMLIDLWLDAIGHFHPVVLHFPLALGVAAALFEVFGWLRRRPAPVPGALPMLGLAVITALLAVLTGWWNAHFGGEQSDTLEWHRWTGIASACVLPVVFLLALSARRHGFGRARVYRVSLVVVAGLLAFCGHLGGEMKWGEGYTTRLLWRAASQTIGTNEPGAGGSSNSNGGQDSNRAKEPNSAIDLTIEEVTFEPHVRALFANHCAECHLGGRRKGRLSLTTREGVVRQNEASLWLIDVEAPEESELLRRVMLPMSDDDAMPPEGNRLTTEEIAFIRRWIERGAP